MLHVIFTLDYEIHGNGDGCPQQLMVKPTGKLLQLFDRYGAKLTIMADVAEIIKFNEYKLKYNRDDYYFDSISDQLRRAIRGGHDVQLHIHPSYFNAQNYSGRWSQDWSAYNFADLRFDTLNKMVERCKRFLTDLLKKENKNYECIAFRAANWAVSPSKNVVRSLINNGIEIDTSVFKYGKREGIVSFDYSNAFSEIIPWKVNENDICKNDVNGKLWEFPIYSERRSIISFLTLMRIYRAIQTRLHRVKNISGREEESDLKEEKRRNTVDNLKFFLEKQTWKADFNQCTGRQLIKTLQYVQAKYRGFSSGIPFVLIGHSKLCNWLNLKSIKVLLEFIKNNEDKFIFSTLSNFGSQTKNKTDSKFCN